MEHISLEKILSYSDNRLDGRETNEIECHLATCERCHEMFMGLKATGDTMGRAFKEETASGSCPEDWEIGALVQKELPSETADKIKGHLKDCSFCVDRAAGYFKALHLEKPPVDAPASWKQKAVQRMESRQAVKGPKLSLIQRILSFFPDMTSPLPVAAGLAAALLAIVVVTWIILPGRSTYTAVASKERLIIRDSEVPSSFGFTGTDEVKEVGKMDIDLNGKEVIFNWKPVEGAVEYKFTLKDGGHDVYDAGTGKDALVALNKDLIEPHITYNWLITGKTSDDKYFEYTGNFVLVK